MSGTTKLVANPDLAYLARLIEKSALMSMNAHALGTIVTFDMTHRKAKVSLNYKKVLNGTPVEYPVLAGCPAIVLGGGKGQITFPISAGDSCLIFFNDVSMDKWIATGNLGTVPDSQRLHSFSDAIVLVGLNSFPQAALLEYFADGSQWKYDTTAIELTDKIKLYNAATDLKTVLNSLIDQIAAITVPALGSPPSNAASILAIKTTLAGLLK